MAEYKSFHYLMHAVPEQIKPHYIQAPKALPFTELYSPRNGTILLGKQEKSFWRTRDRIEFTIYENRSQKVVFVTCRNIDSSDIYRTIFLCAETLFFEVEMKASETESREKLVRKKDKVLNTDELLHKAAIDYILARLLITNDPLSWPDFTIPSLDEPTESAPSTPVRKEAPEITPAEPVGPFEKMCTFSKISSDKYLYLEINKPPALSLEDIPHIKTEPSVTTTEDNVAVVVPAGAVGTLTAAAGSATTLTATASVDTSNNNTTITTVSAGTGSAPTSAPASAPTSAPTSARRNVPPLKLSGSRKTIRSNATPTTSTTTSTTIPLATAAPAETAPAAPALTVTDSTSTTTAAPASTTATNATGTTTVAEAGTAGANMLPSAKKVPSVTTASTNANGKTASAGLAKSRSTVLVKQNSTLTSAKSNNTTSTTAKTTAATATVTAAPDKTTIATHTTNDTAVKATTTIKDTTKSAHNATTSAATATTDTSLMDTVVNPTERQKSVAPSPSSQRTSILGNRNSKKVVPT